MLWRSNTGALSGEGSGVSAAWTLGQRFACDGRVLDFRVGRPTGLEFLSRITGCSAKTNGVMSSRNSNARDKASVRRAFEQRLAGRQDRRALCTSRIHYFVRDHGR